MNFLEENIAIQSKTFNHSNNVVIQLITNFIKSKDGWFIESGLNTLTYQYLTQIDEFQRRKTLFVFQQRKNSYKFTFLSKINPNSIVGGISILWKKIEQFNKNALNENSLYYFNQPHLFAVRSNVQKDQNLIYNQQQFQKSLFKLIQSISNQFQSYLCKLVQSCYQDFFNTNNLKQMSQLINVSKNFYSQEIKRRNNLELNKKQYQFNLVNFNKPNTQLFKQPSKDCSQEEINKLNACFRLLKLQKTKSINQSFKPLASKIKIVRQNVDKNWKAPQSSYGILQRVQAQYITLDSFNTITADIIKKQKNQSQNYYKNVLVRKNYKKDAQCQCLNQKTNTKCDCQVRLKSYNTQVNVVTFIRNLPIDSVASYFLQDNQSLNKTSKLYSKYYPNNLNYDNKKGKDIFHLILNIIQGLKSFNSAGILHRDLKPNNILIDSKKNPKIIDFGSAWILNKNFSQNSQINEQLYTTKKYNLYFQQALFGQRHQMTSMQFEQHPLYDIHAIGVIIRQLFLDNKVSSQLGSFILMNLSWLSTKCTMHNPNLRLNPQEAFNFCILLCKLWILKFNHIMK